MCRQLDRRAFGTQSRNCSLLRASCTERKLPRWAEWLVSAQSRSPDYHASLIVWGHSCCWLVTTGGRFCRTDIVEDHKRLITINNYISQDWNDFNLAVRISSLRFSFGRDWNDKFQLRCSNDKFQLRCSNSTESDQSHARRPEDRNCHPVDRGRLRIPKHITNEMHEWVKTLGWGRIGSRWSRLVSARNGNFRGEPNVPRWAEWTGVLTSAILSTADHVT